LQWNARFQKKLTAWQERAVIVLLSSSTTKDTAKATGANETTIRRWLQQPKFQQRYQAARRMVVENAITELQGLCDEAVGALR
jgi:hypothetical protein